MLFVVSDRPLSSTAPGGSGRVFGSLLALLRARGDSVHLLLLKDAEKPSRFEKWKELDPTGAADLATWAENLELAEFRVQAQAGFVLRKLLGLWDPQRRAYPFLTSGICARVAEVAERFAPDLVIGADLVAGLICSRSRLRVPVVYYHHDFFWKIKKLREGLSALSWRGIWGRWILRRAEERLVRSVDACITGSATELEELRLVGARAVALIPPTVNSEPVAIPEPVAQPCRIVHLGGFGTTATLLGLRCFLDVVWPVVRERVPDVELWVVGDTSAADRDIMARLEAADAVTTGFVPDLSGVLRPGDLHVIPWEFGTGVRTRVVSCFQHGQALVAVRAGVAGYEGLENGDHCILVDTLEELADPLIDLALDPERRVRFARAGQRYMKERLTVEAVLPQFNTVVTELTGIRAAGADGP